MNGMAEWQQANDRFLAAALQWLRLRLTRLSETSANRPSQPQARQDSCWFRRKRNSPSAAPNPGKLDQAIHAAAEEMATAAAVDPPPALAILAQRLGLSRFEQDVLLVCAAMELDTSLPMLCAQAQNDTNRPYPTFALAFTLFDGPAWDALAADRPLRYWRLLEISQPGATPLTACALRADERIVSYLKGLNSLDDRLAPLFTPPDIGNGTEDSLPPSQQGAATAIALRLQRLAPGEKPPVVQLPGPDSLSKQTVVDSALRQLGLQPLRLPTDQIPTQTGDLETFLRLWQRESQLLPVALYIDASEERESAASERESVVMRLLDRCHSPVFLDCREVRPGLGHHSLVVDVNKPTPQEQLTAWTEELGTDAEAVCRKLAAQFNLSRPAIAEIAGTALDECPPEDLEQSVWRACLSKTRPALERLAQRIDAKAQWPDLVLQEESAILLHSIAAQVDKRSQVYDDWGFRRRMNRGLGISALFAGQSGTGKTMAAEVIASALQIDLYRIDLSAVVSKYIGETEKNLRKVFDAAEAGGAILFFDEADALFGKRSEVKDSHDRYANIEINYLLQRMEAYPGLAILATNMKTALDQAFLRRLRFIVNFPFPGVPERKRIWEQVFPPETPTAGLDFDRLAKFNLSGGSIHNIALNAAFHAARTPELEVTMPLIFEAIRVELQKLEKPANAADFVLEKPAGMGP